MGSLIKRFLIIVIIDYTKSSLTLGLEDVLFDFQEALSSIIWGIFDILQHFPQPRKGPYNI